MTNRVATYTANQYIGNMTLAGSRFVAVRKRLGMSQGAFCKAIGVSLGTLHDWEQGRRVPHGSALALLRVLEVHPDAVLDALGRKPKGKG